MSAKTKAYAEVEVTVSIQLPQAWDGSWLLSNIQERGAKEAQEKLRQLLGNGAQIRSSRVKAIIVEEE